MFLDTSGLFCRHYGREARHQLAKNLFDDKSKKFTHSYVLAEFVTLCFSRQQARPATLGFARSLLAHPLVEVIWVGESLHREALHLLEERPDKDYSLCDAVSFVLMRQHTVSEALTTDHHFEQEGFRQLLPA
jgi:predicted nucleic acid-binding protein